jgi:hypothetical protein
MNIFGDPFAGAAKVLGTGAQQLNNMQQFADPTSYAGYPRGMKAEEHSRFMEFVGATHAHEASVVDRYGQAVTAATQTESEGRVAAEAERGRQERLTMSHAVRQGNKVEPGVSVVNGNFSATRQHAPSNP